MDKELARYFLLMVNEKDWHDRFQKLIDLKINNHLHTLETTKEHNRVLEVQGAIAELRRLQHLRDEVNQAAE